ncbi:hypothetical protein A3H75_01135 [Candidatus Uhrbacteria bacterium RIFCSPLOWO2_02_FULL_51_9]|uniref:Uncharacterized protein n=1 Tax=Candidatus Uhrbacteria bacterium RIFCSPLOWO2_02_FULL_51_9 TaxID=1802410 RepID=A0A1F7VEN3_9BACT|nr:MAG: hypothetical protein A3H75_01135 [Candidatus Uhrbacteria bacterium RIFCSPLOWO2_02_FULL_51_9]
MSKASLRQAIQVLRQMEEAEWDSALVQTFIGNWGSIRDLMVALQDGRRTQDEIQAVLEGRFKITPSEKQTTKSRAVQFILPLSDADAVRGLLVKGYTADKVDHVLGAWRRLAESLDYTGPVVWQVKAGFTLKHHAPQAGPCCNGFQYLQDWNFTDEPTKDGLVFFIPRLLTDSVEKNVCEQGALLKETRNRYELPDHHLTSFGSSSILAGLILAHYKATNECVPLNKFWTRSDTLIADTYRLRLGDFGEYGLFCGYWGWDGRRYDGLGCFPLGVES